MKIVLVGCEFVSREFLHHFIEGKRTKNGKEDSCICTI